MSNLWRDNTQAYNEKMPEFFLLNTRGDRLQIKDVKTYVENGQKMMSYKSRIISEKEYMEESGKTIRPLLEDNALVMDALVDMYDSTSQTFTIEEALADIYMKLEEIDAKLS